VIGINTAEPRDISIVGLGMVAVRQVTREVEAALRRSREILYLDHGFGVREYLEGLCPHVTDLYPLSYRDNEPRLDAYDRMSAAVLCTALDHAPVTFAIYGHPTVYVYPTRQITRAASYLGLSVEVLPGISSLDTMLIDLGLDPGLDGLQMYEATEALLRERPLQSDVPCLLWQVGVVESSLYSRAQSSPERFRRLQRYLLRYYPAAHRVQVVYTSGHPLVHSEVASCSIDELPEHLAIASPVATLYIPPAEVRAIVNPELADKLTSVDHLGQLTFADRVS
jgi:uncharacterized protein YabN with tetrapyrrole methylase and pyrophosphatase domain